VTDLLSWPHQEADMPEALAHLGRTLVVALDACHIDPEMQTGVDRVRNSS